MNKANLTNKCTWIAISLMVLLVSCQPAGNTTIAPTHLSPSNTDTRPNEPTPLPEHPEDSLILTPEPEIQIDAQITPTESPLRFTFPTPGLVPVSLWRPPLYEIPWALNPFDHFFFTRPIAADEVNWPLANYRYGANWPGTNIYHTGIDIDASRGTPVIAAAAGKVLWSGYGLFTGTNNPDDPYGLAVSLRHDFGYNGKRLYTVYAHMDRIDVVNGQWVEIGQQLGIVGITGFTTGPHLHFEVRIANNNFYTTRNPELWLAPPQGWGVLAGRIMKEDSTLLTSYEVFIRSVETARKWSVYSYGAHTVNSDDYYRENIALSDLPAGNYIITIYYQENQYNTEITINPGAVSYFVFRGTGGFNNSPPPTPSPNKWLIFTTPEP
jgi:murein DD-endopeptidase MepM/ murein hydrolase activator NlpD